MSGAAATPADKVVIPEYKQIMGHPAPLWMLFMTEFWERFAFYGIRWALVLYIVAQFYGGDAVGQADANLTYGSYLALVYAGAVFGGLIADRVIGYQRSILIGAVFMAAGLFMITVPNQDVFKLGLATIIVGNGMFKPNISTMVGQLYGINDQRRDSGFTIFYMGINAGAFIAPILTQILAQHLGDGTTPAYKVVFFASGVGMLISLVWFYIGRKTLAGIGAPEPQAQGMGRPLAVIVGSVIVIPGVYFLLKLGAGTLQVILTVLFIALALMLMVEGIRNGKVARDKTIAMMIIFAFNILFWMFFEQAGSSFTFLADQIVDRNLGGWTFPVAWFQSVNSVAIIAFAPIIAAIWVMLGRRNANPSIPRKFGLGLIFNGLAFLLLMYAAYRERHSADHDAHGIAFTLAYHNYRRLYPGDALISPERLALLIGGGYTVGWREIPKGGASKFMAGNVKVAKCRRCGLPHLVEAHFRKYECSACIEKENEEPMLLAA